MPQIRISIPDELLLRAEQLRPNYLGQSAFFCLLLDRALDKGVTLGGEQGEPPSNLLTSTSKRSKRNPNPRHRGECIDIEKCFDESLSFVKHKVVEWWQLRKKHHGSKAIETERAWKASHDALLAILKTHGPAVVTATVDEALTSAWRGIRESYAVLPSRVTTAQQREAASAAHPAYQVTY